MRSHGLSSRGVGPLLTLYRSNRAEVLVQLLAAQLRHPPPGPLEPVMVVVNTWPTSRWLGESLALHLGGVSAHLRFPFPGSHLRRVVQLILADGAGTEREADADPWRAIHLVWSVLEDLPGLAAEPEGELLRLWLQRRPFAGRVDLPHWHLARAIADAFDDYALYRPDLLQHWEAGRDLEGNGQPLPDPQRWQPKLYRRLRQRLGGAPFGLRVLEVIRRLEAGDGNQDQVRRHLGERLRLFGPSSMAPIQVKLLQALATVLPVDLYLLTPCPGLWQRCVERRLALSEALALHHPLEGEWMGKAPPLEARFGRLGAEFHQLLEGTGEAQLSPERDEELYVRPTRLRSGPPSLLQQLQEHLLSEELHPQLDLADGDHSLEFHACPGRLRQVQIVRDRVLQLMASDPTLEPRHVLVMTPEVESFAPLVATVFADREATGVDLPWRLTDRSQQQEGGVGRALLELLSLAGDRVTASGLERLLECGPLQHTFGLSSEDAEAMTDLLQRCGFRWGLGAADRQGDPTHSLRWAIDRLLLGFVLPEPDGTWQTNTAPAHPSFPLELAGQVLHLLLRLHHWLELLGQARLCPEWVDLLGMAVDELFGGEGKPDPEIATLHRALEEWRLSAEGCDLALEPAVVGAILQEKLTTDSGRFGHRSGALTISALEPMRAIPHRVVILLGLDAGVFPRQGERPGFHLMERARRLGDPHPADQDRYALLEALLSARDALLITWNCRDDRTGTGKLPAVPVQQWLQWLETTLPEGKTELLRIRHEPNPLDRANFQPQATRPPSSCDRRLLGARRHLDAGLQAPAQGLAVGAQGDGRSASERPTPEDPFEDLRAWLMGPQKVWLADLGLFPRERGTEEVEDLEDLELEERDRAALLREALGPAPRGLPQGATLENPTIWLGRHRGDGRFPPAQGATLEAGKLAERWRSLRAALGALGEERTGPLQWGPWTGCPTLRGDAVVLLQPSRPRANHRLDLWLHLLLAVAAANGTPVRRGVLIARGADGHNDTFAIQQAFAAPDAEGARRQLDTLGQLRQAWREACWPVPPDTGWSWVEQGCPEVGSAALEKVRTTWEGSDYFGGGERQQEEMQLCFGPRRTLESLLEELPFQEWAHTLLAPIFQAMAPKESSN